MTQKCFFYLLFQAIFILHQANAFSIKMFPIDSPHFKLVPKSFSTRERQEYLVNISLSRALRIQNKHPEIGLDSIKSRLSYPSGGSYLVTQLVLANRSLSYTAYVAVDTFSDLTWIQCEKCDPCFPQKQPFPAGTWSSYTRMSLNDIRCVPKKHFNGSCGFEASFGKGHTEGYLGKATFMFEAKKNGSVGVNQQYYPNIGFGCGIHNRDFAFKNSSGENEIVGVFGLNLSPKSFITQLDAEIKQRFSYCLPPLDGSAFNTTLSFGDDAQIGGDDERQVQRFRYKPDARQFAYIGAILVNGARLHIDPKIFELDETEYKTGFFIDPGSPVTLLSMPAYSAVRGAMVHHFKNYGWHPLERPDTYDLCYAHVSTGNQIYPTMAFNFLKSPTDKGEIQFVIPPENLFAKMGNKGRGFCLHILPTDGPSILGAFQQVNHRFLFDIKNEIVSLVPQQC